MDYGHRNVSPDRVGKNLAQSVTYLLAHQGAVPLSIHAIPQHLLAIEHTRLHFGMEPEAFWTWTAKLEIKDSKNRRMVAVSKYAVKKPESETKFRATIWANSDPEWCEFTLEGAEETEARLRDSTIILNTSEVLDWKVRQAGINWGFWRWISPFLGVFALFVVVIECVLWRRRRI